jgi:mevalonate kinase
LKAIAVSPAKVILFGEHFVVGGNTAIAMTIDLPTVVTAELLEGDQIRIRSEDLHLEASYSPSGQLAESYGTNADATLRPIYEVAGFVLRQIGRSGQGVKLGVKSSVPVGMGLGSSAATAVGAVSAITTLLGSSFSKEGIFDAAYSLEKMVHGHPSGVDQATITYGGLIGYKNGKVNSALQAMEPPLVIVGNTGKRRSTGEFVGKVTRLRETRPAEYGKIALEAQKISEDAISALSNGQHESLGALMDENQRLLELVGVSSPELERLINAARTAGALGAKLTGGGGGGCMIAIARESTLTRVASAINQAGGQVVPSDYVPHGVQTSLLND